MTRTRLLLLGTLLIGGLGLLASALAGVQFRGARLEWEQGTEQGRPGEGVPFGFPELALDVLVVLLLALTGLYVAVNLTTREGRQRLLRAAAVLGTAAVVLLLARGLVGPPSVAPGLEDKETAAALPAWDPGFAERAPPARPPALPGWAGYVGSGLIALGVAFLVWRRWASRQPSAAEEVRAAVDAASADLMAGLPVADVVVRCWAQMAAIFARRVREATAPEVTPRELAERLVALGFREEGVWVLTRLFEEVRYGHKDSEPRRGEALAALAAIERAYG